jgi:hypothetical protein
MTLNIEPEIGVPIPDNVPTFDLKDKMEAAANTSIKLGEHGVKLTPNAEDEEIASKLTKAYAEDPERTSKKVTTNRVATLTPASIVLTNTILTEFGRSVVESAVQIRHLVTNKLVLETENPDARARIRALELLGKISDVGLFSEKSEVTITHQSTDDLKAKLRQKLEKLVNPVEDVEDAVVIDGEPIDVDAELGFTDEKD